MKNLIVLFLLSAFCNTSYAFSPTDILPDNATYQGAEHDNLTLEQEGGERNHQAANTKEATADKELTIQNAKIAKELKLKQEKAKKSVQCVNSYTTDGNHKGGVIQNVESKNATYTQSGGSDNIQAGNCILKKR